MRLLLVFLDGVGVGSDDASVNPFARFHLQHIESLVSLATSDLVGAGSRDGTHVTGAIDANLGVEGLPQSGTGQAALFTGLNAPVSTVQRSSVGTSGRSLIPRHDQCSLRTTCSVG